MAIGTARSVSRTNMPQADYARMMGINPIAFEGCQVPDLFQHTNNCGAVWPRFAWQTDQNASRDDLAIQMVDAEFTIGKFALGYNVVPEWIELDMPYPKRKPGQYEMRINNLTRRTIALQQGKIIAGGRRGTLFVDTLDVTYSDEDGDGFKETATITLASEYDWREVRVYHAGTNANPEWEIRPIRSVDEDLFKITFDSWLLVDPEKTSAIPVSSSTAVDISVDANLVDTVDVYLEYNDIYSPSCQFIWTRTNGSYTQDGYLDLIDSEAGVVRPVPATFEYGTECVITPTALSYQGEPDRVKLYFYAGNISDNYKRGYTLDPLDPAIAESVRLLATARLDRELCGCSNIIALGQHLRQDMSLVSPQGNFLAIADAIQECPFGTRRGEWLAWNKMKTHTDKFPSVAIV